MGFLKYVLYRTGYSFLRNKYYERKEKKALKKTIRRQRVNKINNFFYSRPKLYKILKIIVLIEFSLLFLIGYIICKFS